MNPEVLELSLNMHNKHVENRIQKGELPENYTGFEEKNSPQEVIIKSEILDTSALVSDDTKNDLWRPTKFEEYIGQENLKEIIKARIKGCKNRKTKYPHMLIDGSAGTGKTTVAYLTAKYLDEKFVECVANTIQSPQQFVDKLVECDGGVFFVDEVHEISRKVANFILPILEDFQINGQPIKPFTFFGCTTELGTLIKKYKPLVERMKIQKTLEPYTKEEMVKIIKQFKNKSFAEENIENIVYEKIADNCRNTPRMGLRILENYIYMDKTIDNVLYAEGIVKDGLTHQDIKVLKLLEQNIKGVGLKAIASYLGTSEENYLYKSENYLLQKGLITITSRRIITDEGKFFLKSL